MAAAPLAMEGLGKGNEQAGFQYGCSFTDAELAVEKGRLMSTALFEELNDAGSDYYKLNSWDAHAPEQILCWIT